MAEEEYALVLDLTENELDQDWLRAARLKEKCDAGDRIACEQLQAMQEARLWPHDYLAVSKENK